MQPASEPRGAGVVITGRLGTFVVAGIKQGGGYLHRSSFTAAEGFSGHLLSIENSIYTVLMQKRSELL